MTTMKLGSWGIPEHLSDLCGELAGWAKQTAIETGEPIEETAEDRGAQAIRKLALALMHYADERIYKGGFDNDRDGHFDEILADGGEIARVALRHGEEGEALG